MCPPRTLCLGVSHWLHMALPWKGALPLCGLPGVKTKKPIQTKFRMPLLNWVALKPSQITGTVFTELDDEKVLQVSVGGWLPGRAVECAPGHCGGCLLSHPSLQMKVWRLGRAWKQQYPHRPCPVWPLRHYAPRPLLPTNRSGL